MKRKFLAYCLILALCSNCKIFSNQTPAKGVYVRIINSGDIPVRSYILSEPGHHKPLQHFFSGLKPGDSTNYLLFKKVNTAYPITVILDTLFISSHPAECSHCYITEAKKITVHIKVAAAKEAIEKHAARVEVHYDY